MILPQLLRKHYWPSLAKAGGLVLAYAVWVALFRLLALTFVTYFLTHSLAIPLSAPMGKLPRFEDISEVFGSNELTLMGIAAGTFVLLLRNLYPLTATAGEDLFSPQRLEKKFLPGFIHGALLVAAMILALLLGGSYRFMGVYIQFDEVPLAMATVVMRVLALAVLAYSEEYIFRRKLAVFLREWPPILVALSCASVFCAVKMLQFDLGLMHLLTLFLISLALSVRYYAENDFGRGAGFWAGILIIAHPLLSLPVLGNDFSGLFLVKYQAKTLSETARFFTGGSGGPLQSFAFQLLLIMDVARGFMRNKKTILRNPAK